MAALVLAIERPYTLFPMRRSVGPPLSPPQAGLFALRSPLASTGEDRQRRGLWQRALLRNSLTLR